MMIPGNGLKQYMMTTKVAMDTEGFVCLYVTKAAISIIDCAEVDVSDGIESQAEKTPLSLL